MFAWDLYRLRRIQRAYAIWFAAFITLSVAVHLLWNTPWWLAFVPQLMGLS